MRHFNTHKCLATGDYGILSDEEEEENEYDQTPDYKPKRREIEQAEAEEDDTTESTPKRVTAKDSAVGK